MEFNPFSYDVHEDPYPIYRWLRDEAPAYRNDAVRFWAISRHQDVVTAHLDTKRYSSSLGTTLEGYLQVMDTGMPAVPQPMIINMDPPAHSQLRTLVARPFTPSRIGDLEDYIRGLARTYLERRVADGRLDIVEDFSAKLPINVISELLGLPVEIRDHVRDASDRLLHREDDQRDLGSTNQDAAAELAMMLYSEIQKRYAEPTDDLIGALVGAELQEEDGSVTRLTDEQLIGFCILLSVAGNETVTKLIANAAIALDQFPDQRAVLLEHPELIANAVDETLRWDAPSQYQGRYLLEDVALHDTTMPAGDFVLLLTGSANRDERKYDHPDDWDVRRRVERPMGFGHGPHLCLGAALARLETRIAMEEMLRLFPDFEVDHDHVVRMHGSNVRGLSSVPITFSPHTVEV